MASIIPVFGKTIKLTKDINEQLEIEFTLPEYTIAKDNNTNHQSGKIMLASDDEEWYENMSGLPQCIKWVYIPAGFKPIVTITKQEHKTIQNTDLKTEPTTNIDDNWIEISEPASFRGNRLFSICYKPFQYNTNSKELSVMKQAEVKIDFVADYTYNVNTRLNTPETAKFIQDTCINPRLFRTTTPKPGSYVVFYNGTALTSYVEPYVTWKKQKGYDIRMVNIANIGTTNQSIKNYLQNAYDTWENPPEFILLLGKATGSVNQVPSYIDNYSYQTYGDYKYTLLDGPDIIPDAYIGRLTFANTDELQTVLTKLINYEKNQGLVTSVNWLNKAFLLGDTSDSGESCQTTMYYVKSLIQSYNPLAQITETYSGTFPSQISAAINSGVSAYWYRGHGDTSGWTNTNIDNLTNGGKYPFISYITCFTGNFGNSSTISQSEKFMRVGTPSAPKGAIGVIGASCETHTCLNNIVTGGIALSLYSEGVTQAGPAMIRGKLALMANYPQNPANYLNQYMQQINLFGDPGLNLWLKPITDIVVTAPTQLYANGGNARVRVTLADGTPLDGAWVCLTKGIDEIQVSGFTDTEGYVVLPYHILTTGIATLTITKPSYKTYQYSINVVAGSPEFTAQEITALQQSYAGKTITFPMTITNNSATTYHNVAGVLSTTHEYVTIPQNQAVFGNIPADGNAVSQSSYQVHLNQDFPKGEVYYLNLHLTFTEGSYDIPLLYSESGANINLESATFGNDVLSHGTNQLSLSLKNIGQASVSNLSVVLECMHPLVTIPNPSQIVDSVAVNQTITLPVNYSIVVSDTLLEGITVRFNLLMYNDDGFLQNITLDKQSGTPSFNDVTGPDAYGYVCTGPGDTPSNEYNWLEIDPSLGGTGTNLNLIDTNTEGSGSFATVTLPFQLRFYGKTYGQITVCSNGFIMPGNQGSVEWMNWQIPGPMVPRPIIAPFWDDLLTDASARVLHKYDEVLHAEIIQWQNLKNKYSPTLRETFQVILYDPMFHSSPTGDSPIRFQYKVFNNVDAGNYGTSYIDHGQFATIGIGDHTGTMGLSYTYNNQYPATAQVLTNQSTLYFTTLPIYLEEAHPILLTYQMAEINGNNNNLIDAGETISLNMTIKNTGSGVLPESQVTLQHNDPFVTLLQGQASLPMMLTEQISNVSPLFSFQVASNCPNNHLVQFNLVIDSGVEQYTIPFEMAVHALELQCSNMQISDGNNNFPEPGETVQMSINLNNVSMIDAQSIQINAITPQSFTASPAQQIVAVNAMSSITLQYQLVLDTGIVQGTTVEMSLHLTNGADFNIDIPITFLVGVPQLVFETNFDNTDLVSVFPYYYNVHLAPSQYIHNTGSEAIMTFGIVQQWNYVLTNPFNALDLLTARVEFTWFNSNPEANLSLNVMYDDESNLVLVWNSSIVSTEPQHVVVDLFDFPDNNTNISFAFMGNINGTNTTPLVLDDVKIHFMRHAPGFITGHVNLDMFPENVTQARIRLKNTTQTYNPDEYGNFTLPAYQGRNVLYADLEGYLNVTDSLVVDLIGGQTVNAGTFNFERMRAPINLDYSLAGNQITLSWDLEGILVNEGRTKTEQRDRLLVPDYYRVWIRCNNLNYQDTSPTMQYTRNLTLQGDYRIYVCAVYLFGGLVEFYSSPSNALEFNYTLDEQNTIPQYRFALQQNTPNPFNPNTTISFSLPEKQRAELNIYNVKGQLIKSLVNDVLDRGEYSIVWNGKDNNNHQISSGIYYYKLKWKDKQSIRKMILLK
jgi:hypothetical protein